MYLCYQHSLIIYRATRLSERPDPGDAERQSWSTSHHAAAKSGKRELRSGTASPRAQVSEAMHVQWKQAALLTVPLLANGESVDALIDTGSQPNLINADALHKLGATAEPLVPNIILEVANGTLSTVNRHAIVEAVVGDRCRRIDFIVVPGLPKSAVLGLDFIMEHGLSINCHKSKRKHYSMSLETLLQ